MSEIASNYAEALLSVAIDNDKVKKFKDELSLINEIFKNVDGFNVFFANVKISKNEKKQLLEDSFKGKIDQLLLNFLKVLVDRTRITMYDEIFKEYRKVANKQLNIKEGVVESARPLSDSQIKTLEKSLGDNVELYPRINANLISGFKIILDNQIIDVSMREKIDNLSSMLLGRS